MNSINISEFCKKYKKSEWVSVIKKLNFDFTINDVLTYANECVYYSTHSTQIPATSIVCLKCSTPIEILYKKGIFAIKRFCGCSRDGKHKLTVSKLETVFTSDESEKIFSDYCSRKTRNFKTKTLYWQSLGYSEEEALEKVKEIQAARSALSPAAQPGAVGYSVRQIEYWLKLGYSEDEALLKVKESQVKNGIEWYTEKYGEVEGAALYNKRIEQYKKSCALAVEADPSINLRKMVAICRASKESLNVFLPVIEDLKLTDYFIGYGDRYEYMISDSSATYSYDFAIPSLKLIFEYNGSCFHPNKDVLSEEEWKSWRGLYSKATADALYDKDQKKRLLAESKGFSVHYIWDTDDTRLAIERIKTLISEA